MGNAQSHPSSDAPPSSHHLGSAPIIPQKETPSSFLPFPETDENGIAIRDPLEAPKAVTVPERSTPPPQRDVHFLPWPKRPAATSDEEDIVAKNDPPDALPTPSSETTEPSPMFNPPPPHRRRSTSPARRSLRKVRKTIANAAHRVDHFFNPPLRDTSSDSKWLAAGKHLPKVPVLLEGCADLGTHHLCVGKVLRDVRGKTGGEGLKVAGFEYRTVRCGEHEDASLCALTEEEEDTVGTTDDAGMADGGGSAAAEAVGGKAWEASLPKTELKCASKACSLETIGLGSTEDDEANEERDSISAAMEAVEPEGRTSSTLPSAEGHSAADVVHSGCSASPPSACQSKMDDEGGASSSSLTVPLAAAEAAAEAASLPSGSDALPPLPADCPACSTRLFHVSTNTMITLDNRRRYIADGKMYDEIARLCQEFAQQLMRTEGSLEWVTICDDASKGQEPIRALVDRAHHLAEVEGHVYVTEDTDMDEGGDSNDLEEGDRIIDTAKSGSTEGTADSDASHTPMLLIATGKGKVRAGIFSRQHLLTTGIEPSTALPMVREAKRRGMRCAILDPNARGDKQGMVTFERSVRAIFGHDDNEGNGDDGRAENLYPGSGDRSATESAEAMDMSQPAFHHHRHRRRRSPHPTYILAHSAAGAHLVRYLKKHMPHALPSIAAVAFTDSTHNIQWTRDDPHLCDFLQSERTVYVRSSEGYQGRHGEGKPAGEEVCTDEHWRRRFGSVRTLWAGTGEHSLANWYSHQHIWDHFDRNRWLSSHMDEDSRVGHDTSPSSRSCGGGGASRAGKGSGRHPRQCRHAGGADSIVGRGPPFASVTRDRHGRPLSPITV